MPSIRATATATPRGSSGQFIQSRITPAIRAAVQAATQLVLEEAQSIVPVDTGELRDSGRMDVRDGDKTVIGTVEFTADHSAYVEWGTGIAGASSAGAGKGPYSPTWPGMVAQPYLRPALDTARSAIKEVFASQISAAMK